MARWTGLLGRRVNRRRRVSAIHSVLYPSADGKACMGSLDARSVLDIACAQRRTCRPSARPRSQISTCMPIYAIRAVFRPADSTLGAPPDGRCVVYSGDVREKGARRGRLRREREGGRQAGGRLTERGRGVVRRRRGRALAGWEEAPCRGRSRRGRGRRRGRG